MENTVGKNTEEFGIIIDLMKSSVFKNPLDTNKNISRDNFTFRIIKRDDVGVIIVLEEILVNLKYFLVGTKHKCQFTYFFAVIRDKFFNPGFQKSF